jgi:hypothetical protein
MVMIPVGADGEPRLDLMMKKPRTIANCEDYRKSKDGARNASDGFVIQYNFLRNHTSLQGRTPAQATGLCLPIEKGWSDFIQWSVGVPARE